MTVFTENDSFLKNADQTWSYAEQANGELRFEVRGGDYYDNPLAPPELDDEAQGKNRSEITSLKKTQFGREFTLEYDFLVESGAPNSAGWLLLTQLRQTEDLNPDGSLKDSGAASPPFAVQMRGERLEITGRTDPNAVTQATPDRITTPGFDTLYLDENALPRDTWINLRIEVVFDADPSGSGALRVWRDGVQIVNYSGPLGYNDDVGPYLQMGVYREQTPESFAVRYRDITYEGDGLPPPINGTDGDDDLNANRVGFYESEILNGGAGNDTLDGGVGADTMNGGTGDDEYFVDNVGDVVNDQGGTDLIKTSVSLTMGDEIENLLMLQDVNINATGNAKDNRIQGNGGQNTILGGEGDDELLAGGGNDRIDGQGGNDRAFGDAGDDTVLGGTGNDEIYGDDGADELFGGDGNDTLYGGAGIDTMTGGAGDDIFVVEQTGDVVIDGVNQGNDTIRAAVSFDAGASNSIEVITTIDISDTAAINLTGTDGDNEVRGNAGINVLTGRGGDDLILGYEGNDTLSGGAGNDTLNGGAGVDSMSGGAGNDEYNVSDAGETVTEAAGEGIDTVRATADFDAGLTSEIEVINAFDTSVTTALNLTGSNTDNELRGTNGENRLVGRDGNDRLQGFQGDDTLDAGAGQDTVFADEGDDSVIGGAGNDSILAGDGNDTVLSGADDDTVFGGAGNDQIEASSGNDSVLGEAGDDTILAGDGNDIVSGGEGADSLVGWFGNDSLTGEDGDDTLDGGSGVDTLAGGAGRDLLQGGAGDDSLFGGDGADTLEGGDGNDSLYGEASDLADNGGVMRGGAGDDTYFVTAANTTITEAAGGGTDTVRTSVTVTLRSDSEVEVLRVDDDATTNAVNLTGSAIANELRGNAGDNVLRGGAGDDTMRGFGGDDTYFVDSSSDVVIEADGEGTDRILTTTSFQLGSNVFVETLEVTPSASLANVTLTGNDQDNILIAASGDDSLSGGGGNDTLTGGDGDDTISGGDGTDTFILSGINSTEVTATAGPSNMRLQSLTGEDIISNDVEFIQFDDQTLTYDQASTLVTTIELPSALAGDDERTGTDGNDTLNGGGGNDTLNGLGGNDRLFGGDDFDTLDGGAGNDTLYSGAGAGNGAEMRGGAGDDIYFIDAAGSTITETAGNGTDTARVSVSFTLDANDDIETLQVNDVTTDNALDLTGSDIANTLRGNAGDNRLDGAGGVDTMIGFDGDDTYVVRQVGDSVVEGEGQGQDTILTAINYQIGSTQFIEVLRAIDETSTNGLTLTGNALDNDIHGTDGADSLSGAGGNDRLFAKGGDDTLRGGDGVDEVVLDIASTQASGTLRLVDMVLQTTDGTKLIGEDVERIVFTDQTLSYAEAAQLVSSVAIPGDLTSNNTLSGTNGVDSLFGGRGNDTIDGQDGNDRIFGDAGADSLLGGAGNDTLYTGTGPGDTLEGGTGNDLFFVTAENTTVTEAAGGGTDQIETSVDLALAANSQVETINIADPSGIAGLSITGSDIANTIRGNAGNNTLDGGAGVDRMFGYGGDDLYFVDNAGDRTFESAGGGTDTVLTSVALNLNSVDDIEILRAQNAESTSGLALNGNALDNLIAGTNGADSLRGEEGNDTLIAYQGDDTIYGDAGTDIAQIAELSTEVTGRINGSLLTLYTANGTKIIHNSTEQLEFLDQTVSYADAGMLISQIVVPGDPFGPNDIRGTDGADTLNGLAGNDTLRGLDGNDRLFGDEGVDTLLGGAGNDSLYSGSTDDPLTGGRMVGGTGNDIYFVDAARSTIVEAAGNGTDTVRTSVSIELTADADIEFLQVNDLNSTNVVNLTGSDIGQTIRGNAGNNALDGRGGADTMFGGLGDDLYFIDNAGDDIREFADSGFDVARTTIDLTLSSVDYVERIEVLGTAGLTIQANQLDNGVFGGVGDDWLLGQAGNDTLVGGFGDDRLNGGDGIDRAVFEVASTQVTTNRGATAIVLNSAEGADTVRDDVEFFVFTDTILTYAEASVLVAATGTVNRITGDETSQTLNGTEGSDSIEGLGGFDWIIPGRANDTVDGGADRDMVSYSDVTEVAGRGTNFMLDLDLGAGTAQIFGGEIDQLRSIERVTGSIFADVLRGTDGDDELRGIGDYDWFVATTGNDTLNGGNGLDMLTFLEWGGTGAAVVEDVFSPNGAPPVGAAVGGVTLDLSDPSQSTGLATGLTLISVERVTGSSYQDVFYGDDQQNDFRGLGGYDWFVGSTGGRERYFGGDGLDTVTYYQSTSGVAASLRNGAGLSGGQETGYGSAGDAIRDLYFEIENLVGTNFGDRLEGNSERNQLSGLDGDDYLLGYGGIDYLKGGAGNDTLDGGAGSDFAVFDGNRGDYTLTRTSATEVTIAGATGTDSLVNVEYFQFDDTTANIWELTIV